LGFEWEAYDAVNEVGIFGGGGSSITVSDLPVIDHTGPGLSGPIAAQFVTPDRIEGTWTGGNVSLFRIGTDNGAQYRFVGRADNRTPGSELAAYLSLTPMTATASVARPSIYSKVQSILSPAP